MVQIRLVGPNLFPIFFNRDINRGDNSNHSSRESRNTGECSTLVNCATKCIEQSNFNFTEINHCIRHQCAYHCFDGSCPTCSAFITKLFRQICISGNLRKKTNFQGRCYEMFRVIVGEKFKEQFKRSGRRPAIDIRTNLLWLIIMTNNKIIIIIIIMIIIIIIIIIIIAPITYNSQIVPLRPDNNNTDNDN
ncbi:Protein C29G2.6 [Dirofilaria immitis]|nr:Protein C29G2.6 [Dirofilaria immitis]